MCDQKVTLEFHCARSQNRTAYPPEELPQEALRANASGTAAVRIRWKSLFCLTGTILPVHLRTELTQDIYRRLEAKQLRLSLQYLYLNDTRG